MTQRVNLCVCIRDADIGIDIRAGFDVGCKSGDVVVVSVVSVVAVVREGESTRVERVARCLKGMEECTGSFGPCVWSVVWSGHLGLQQGSSQLRVSTVTVGRATNSAALDSRNELNRIESNMEDVCFDKLGGSEFGSWRWMRD